MDTSVTQENGLKRRQLMAGGIALGTAGLMAPALLNSARAAGTVRLMTWAGYDFAAIKAQFERDTGMALQITALPDQDAMAAQMKATQAAGFDVCEPTADRVADWVGQGFIQPLDETRAKISGLNAAFLSGVAADSAKVGGKRYATPSVWGTESICFDKTQAPMTYGTASYGDLWSPKYAGKVTVRAHSCLVGLGLFLESQGKLPHPMRAAFTDPAVMTAVYDVILKEALAHKSGIAQFWTDENSAQGAFRSNGCVIGQNWDTTAAALMKDGLPIGYVAAKEGALAWLQNFVIPAKANLDASYAWFSWMNSAKPSAAWAQAYGANPAAQGASELMPATTAKFIAAAYPGDALEKLFWWPAQPTWFISKRNEYVDKLQGA